MAEIDSAAPSTRVETPSGQPASAAGLYTEPLAGSAASPPGARWSSPHRGCHFSLPSTSASAVSLVLFTPEDLAKGQTTAEIPLDPTAGNRTGDVWHVLVPSLAPGLLYAWRVTGADESLLVGERAGPYVDRSDPRAPVLDPWATAVASRARWGEAHPAPGAGRPGERESLHLAPTWPQHASPVPAPIAARDTALADALGGLPQFDWEGDRPLGLPAREVSIYELHLRGFTADPSSGLPAPLRGTWAGAAARLDHVAALGFTAVELLPGEGRARRDGTGRPGVANRCPNRSRPPPQSTFRPSPLSAVHEFNELEYLSDIPNQPPDPATGHPPKRVNYWGYSTVAFWAPQSRLSASAQVLPETGARQPPGAVGVAPGVAVTGSEGGAGSGPGPAAGPSRPGAELDEFRSFVKAAHRRGLEVILDVVFNHTAEGDERGPSLSFRGVDDRAWYMQARGRRGHAPFLTHTHPDTHRHTHAHSHTLTRTTHPPTSPTRRAVPPRRLLQLQRVWQHGQLQPPNSAQVRGRLLEMVGDRVPRRRIPL